MLLKRILCKLKTYGKKANVLMAFYYNKIVVKVLSTPSSSQPTEQAFVCGRRRMFK
jgi:hypothetical protein